MNSTKITNIWPMGMKDAFALDLDYQLLPAIIIRIAGDTRSHIPLRNATQYIAELKLVFGDSTPKETWLDGLAGGKLFTRQDAEEIQKFVTHYSKQYVKTIIIHCNAGMSRSPAVALAVAELLDLHVTIQSIAFNFNFFPNQHVLAVCREVFGTRAKLAERYAEIFGKPVDPFNV
jgi:predicted protein tyrosine phosphatase